MIQLIKKYLIFLIIFLFCFLFIINLTISFFSRQEKNVGSLPLFPTPTPLQIRFPSIIPTPNFKEKLFSQSLGKISFTLSSIQTPSEIHIFKIGSYEIKENQAISFAKTLGFKTNPTIVKNPQNYTIISWKEDLKILSIIIETGFIQYNNSFIPAKADLGSPPITLLKTPDEAISIANKYLESHGLLPFGLSSEKADVLMYAGGSDLEETKNFSEASVIEIRFKRIINNLIVLGQNENTAHASVWIDKFKTIKKIEYQYPQLAANSAIYNIISLDEAKEKIMNNQGTIIRIGSEENPVKKDVFSSSFINVSFSYFDDRKDGFIQPVFVFKGLTQLASGKSEEVVVYVPATK